MCSLSWASIWLLSMCACYTYPVYIVLKQQETNLTVSSILKDSAIIFICMIAMGLCTLCYEFTRFEWCSLWIVSLLYGIYGLLIFDESYEEHYFYGAIAFASIYIFTILQRMNWFIFVMITLQTMLLGMILLEHTIILYEIFYIFLFAVTYFYLHFYS
jgi:hypothetical protein